MEYWLGLDCGGTFIKAGLYDRRGHEHGVARRNLAIVAPQPGWAERDMASLWRTAADVIREVLSASGVAAGAIQAIGISAQGKGAFLLDKQGQPLGNAMLSSDQRAGAGAGMATAGRAAGAVSANAPNAVDRAPGLAAALAEAASAGTLRPHRQRADGARLPALLPDRRAGLRRNQYLRIQPVSDAQRTL